MLNKNRSVKCEGPHLITYSSKSHSLSFNHHHLITLSLRNWEFSVDCEFALKGCRGHPHQKKLANISWRDALQINTHRFNPRAKFYAEVKAKSMETFIENGSENKTIFRGGKIRRTFAVKVIRVFYCGISRSHAVCQRCVRSRLADG